jgi:hypothetical protein
MESGRLTASIAPMHKFLEAVSPVSANNAPR